MKSQPYTMTAQHLTSKGRRKLNFKLLYYANVTGGAFDAQGGFSAVISLPIASLAAEEQIAMIVICNGGTGIGDTSEFSEKITVDYQAPRVVKVEVGNENYMYEVATNATGNDQLIPVMPDENDALDGGIDWVKITFDRPLDNDLNTLEDALTVDMNDPDWLGWPEDWPVWSDCPTTEDVSFSGNRTEVTWKFSGGPYTFGEMILELSAASVLANGIELDGEWYSPENWEDTTDNSTFEDGGHSGNDIAGGDFTFNFTLPNTFPGDTDRDGDCDWDDFVAFSSGWFGPDGADPQNPLPYAEWATGDFDLDGDVDWDDHLTFSAGWFMTLDSVTLWPAPPPPPPGGGGMGGESLFDDDDRSALSAALDAVFEQYGFAPNSTTSPPVVGSDAWDDFLDDFFSVLN